MNETLTNSLQNIQTLYNAAKDNVLAVALGCRGQCQEELTAARHLPTFSHKDRSFKEVILLDCMCK